MKIQTKAPWILNNVFETVLWVSLLSGFAVSGCGGGSKSKGEKTAAEVALAQSTMRSCELLLQNTETAVLDSVSFGSGVVGFFKKRGDETGIAFVAKEDASISSDAVIVTLSSGKASGLVMDPVKSKCFDSAGVAVDDVLWTL
jgi:hypothetical protein